MYIKPLKKKYLKGKKKAVFACGHVDTSSKVWNITLENRENEQEKT